MSISNQRIVLFRGEKYTINFAIVDDDGVAVNITGWPICLVIVSAQNGATYETKLTIGAGVTITNGAGGIGKAILTRLITHALGFGQHWYALQDDDTDDAAVLADGTLTVQGPQIFAV